MEKKEGFFKRLTQGLSKTRKSFSSGMSSLFMKNELDDDFYDELEEHLILADMGMETTEKIIDELKKKVKENHVKEVSKCRELLVESMAGQMSVPDDAYDFLDQKSVIFVVGINGVGKTTTIGKLAAKEKAEGKKVLLAAGDTFRAAATEQLKEWSNRAGVDIISAGEGADPAAVLFDAVNAAKARNTDILICDTAGRLHNKKNLMDELGKMERVITREYPDCHLEVLLVLDGTAGQNALVQAREFDKITHLDGLVITKLDGTAKGGIAVAISSELNVPVKFIGVGESVDDLQRFDPESYVRAMFMDEE